MPNKFNKHIGEKIKALRGTFHLTQEDLAKKLGISRSAVTHIESGQRKLSAEEIHTVCEILNVEPQLLLNPELPIETEIIIEESQDEGTSSSVRISVPQKNLDKFKEVLLYILEKIGSKPNVGETVLYKLLYFIDFDFYEKYEEQLIGATYMKNHHGPTPIEFAKIIEYMINEEAITAVRSKYFKYPQKKYLPLREPNLAKLRAHEIIIIDEVLARLSDMNASQISDYSHHDVPWLVTDSGETIQYETAFYRTSPYSVR